MRFVLFAAMSLLAACATPPALAPETIAADVRAGRLDISALDLSDATFWTDEAARHAWAGSIVAGLGPSTYAGCAPEDLRTSTATRWLMVLMQTSDHGAWLARVETLRNQSAALEALADARARGEVDPAMEENPAIAAYQLDMSRGEARSRELFARVIRDQTIRPGAQATLDGSDAWTLIRGALMAQVDCDNTLWLESQLAEIGWFDIPRFGEGADGAAWVLTQHADRRPDFQRRVLTILEGLPAGATNPVNLAYLSDRIAVAEGRPQLYGTQGACVEGGGWAPHNVEDPDLLDARRTEIGLMPMAEYVAVFTTHNLCPPPPAP